MIWYRNRPVKWNEGAFWVIVEGVVRGREVFDGYFVAAQMDIDVGEL